MRYKLIKFFSLFILIVSQYDAFPSNKDSIEFVLTMPVSEIQTSNDLRVDVSVKSNQILPLIMTKDAALGYVNEKIGFFRVQVQQKIGGKYIDIKHHGLIDNAPTDLDTLYKGDLRKFDLSIRLLYHFIKGDYRIRILAAFSILNPSIKDSYSNWSYFTCKKEILIE